LGREVNLFAIVGHNFASKIEQHWSHDRYITNKIRRLEVTMPAPFHRLSLEEFAALLDQFPFSRQINSVHMHHTWRPNHSQDRGLESIKAIWRFHTQTNGWSDIAQHITISSNGDIWTGRNWNQPPVSASGHNGNRNLGPFMFEIIGDLDLGRDHFEGCQREVALEVIARVQMRFGLPLESLRFHNQMSLKSCPGTAIGSAKEERMRE
jgi:hypothetical protein